VDNLLLATTGHGSALRTEEKEAPHKARAPTASKFMVIKVPRPPWAAEQTVVEKEAG
jgi:mannose-6-phosphate isomerase-like protein (cupin superfamily)